MASKTRSFGCCLAAIALADCAVAGPVWNEQTNGGGDAGLLHTSAQITTGTGPINGIVGELQGAGDREDVYAIQITDPMMFSVRTDVTPFAGSSFDTQLWLFDSMGFGLLSNDNETGVPTLDSFLTSPANDGTGQIIPAPGLYYLAITGSGDSALSSGGPIYFFLNPDEISGPDGPGALNPLIGWTGNGPIGTYSMTLTGASFATVPGPGAFWVFLGAGLIARTRRRNLPR